MATYDYDLFVIGGGSGGVRAARVAAGLGKRVAIAEEYRFGGTCVIRGCVPKKLFVYASQFPEHFEDAAGFGWTVGETSFDWPTLIANKDREIGRLESIYESGVQKAGGETYHSRAELLDAHTVRIVAENRTVTAEFILIATGGRPNPHAALPGHELCILSDHAFHLETLPKSIVIAGGGGGVAAFGSALPIFASARHPSDPAATPKLNTAMSGKRTFLDMTRCLLDTDSTAQARLASPSAGNGDGR